VREFGGARKSDAVDEYRDARASVERKMLRCAPRAIAFLAKPAISALLRSPKISWGRQPDAFASAAARLLLNPSGLNRAFDLAGLVDAYRTLSRISSLNRRNVSSRLALWRGKG
jgi:hypothetical protein